jgi:hypothetical protein
VRLTQDAISVDVSTSRTVSALADKGGADSSAERNNVFSVRASSVFSLWAFNLTLWYACCASHRMPTCLP